MIRKMQSKAKSTAQVDQDADKFTRLFLDAVIMLLMAATVVWVLSLPALANEPTEPTGAEPLSVITHELPANFQVDAADAGLHVIGVDAMTAMPLPFYHLTIRSADNLSPQHALEALNARFPTVAFQMMNGTDEMFELHEN